MGNDPRELFTKKIGAFFIDVRNSEYGPSLIITQSKRDTTGRYLRTKVYIGAREVTEMEEAIMQGFKVLKEALKQNNEAKRATQKPKVEWTTPDDSQQPPPEEELF